MEDMIQYVNDCMTLGSDPSYLIASVTNAVVFAE